MIAGWGIYLEVEAPREDGLQEDGLQNGSFPIL
jgi:hypothetical protein